MRRIHDPVPWVLGLFAANFFLQRLSLPGISIPVTVPFVAAWIGLALFYRVVAINVRRLTLWLGAGALSGLVMIGQLSLVNAPFVSFYSWAFWMVIWLPVVVQIRDRSKEQYHRCLRAIARFGVGLSALSVLFVVLQLVGVTYRDWIVELVPPQYLVQYYAISYPIVYGSPIYKSNAWFALEPSFLSFILGVCAVSAILTKMRTLPVLWILLGMLATTAGSGIAVLGVAVVALVVTGRGFELKRYIPAAAVAGIVAGLSPFGQSIVSRLDEASQQRSSTSLRAIEPYVHLWPNWVSDPAAVFFGRGAGSSRWIIDNLGVGGLLVPSVPKVLFDYGLIGGPLLVALMISVYVRSPEPVFAIALAVSMFTIQSASQPLVMCSFAVVSLWAPRPLHSLSHRMVRTASYEPRLGSPDRFVESMSA